MLEIVDSGTVSLPIVLFCPGCLSGVLPDRELVASFFVNPNSNFMITRSRGVV